ncbi:MAG TPA: ATP-binding protein, partial [Chitinophagaceae bacterium]|nr:ATP-binding protein [Chitinophagaceae bacterium]
MSIENQDTDANEKAVSNNNYGASSIQVLEGLEAVRKRPAMYIGDIGSKGLHHLVYEVVDNSIDEAMAGHCDKIDVIIHENNSITVQDNGRGIPTDLHEKENRSALEVVMTVLHAGGKFDKDSYKVSGGLHGVGVSCVNALSNPMKVEVYREGKIYNQEYKEGIPLYPVKEVGQTDITGTKVTFQPDPTIFKESVFDRSVLANRLRELSFLNKGITITLLDERIPEITEDQKEEESGEGVEQDVASSTKRFETFYSEGGILEFVQVLDNQAKREKIIEEPIFVDTLDEKSNVKVEVALMYNAGYSEHLYSYVNNINTIEGGTHVA